MFDWNFGPQIQVYYLIAAWCVDLHHRDVRADTRTPLGRMCNAVRDNPERVQFIGYNPHVVRYHRLLLRRLLRRHRRRPCGDQFRDRQRRPISARCSPASCCSRPTSAASATSSGRLSARSSSPICSSGCQRLHAGLAALFRRDLHRDRDVRARRHRRPADDASAAVARAALLGWSMPSYLIALVPTLALVAGSCSCIEIDRAPWRQGRRDGSIMRCSALRSTPRAASPGSVARCSWRGAASSSRDDLAVACAGVGRRAHGSA